MGSILAFSGSLAAKSINQQLVHYAADVARGLGAEVDVISLRDFDLPLMNTDLEAEKGLPADAIKLKDLMKRHSGFIIGCPEYNSSITPALKNAIDWATRPREGEKPLECFAGKHVALCATSEGALGGLRGLDHVREILGNIQAHIVPGMVSVPGFSKAFSDGKLVDELANGMLDKLMSRLVHLVNTVG